jgi:hypothetical protein
MKRSFRILTAAVLALFMGIGGAVSAMPAAASAEAAVDYECRDYSGRDYISVLRPLFRLPTSTDRKVLGISGGSMNDRAHAIIADYHGDLNQRWSVRACSIDDFNQTFWFQLMNGKSGKCLDKSEDRPNGNGNVIYQYTCENTYPAALNQLWNRREDGGSVDWWRQLWNAAGGGCIDIRNEQYVNGAELVQWDCAPSSWDDKSHTQQWNIT